jgi:uncharacterized membrane protein
MQIANPIQMNDWKIKKFFGIILAIELALWGFIGLDAIGIQFPIARELVGFIYLTFVPGVILLRILKIHGIGNIETILYSVGLSIVTLMSTGALMNALLPSLGISRPISTMPLLITISLIILILCTICYMRDRSFHSPNFIDFKGVLSPAVLFLCLIPFLAIFGTYAVNFYHLNTILVFMLLVISAIVVFISFDAFISHNMFPFAVFIIALSLLYHGSLISMYIWGWDINHELYLSNLVNTNCIWNPAIPYNCNAMLSIVMLAPIYSHILDLNITWIFKIIYPFLFSLVPLGLYRVFQKQADNRIAFVSCIFFVSLNCFYTEMLNLARQQIAELFLTLLILLMISKNMDKTKRAFLFIIFGMSLVVSHYGLSYIFMLCLILTWIMLVLAESPRMKKRMSNPFSNFSRKNDELAHNRTINSAFVLLFITFALTWYIHFSDSSALNSIARIGKQIFGSIYTDFFDPDAVQGVIYITAKSKPGLLHDINKIMNYLNQFLIIIGVIVLLLKINAFKFEREYIYFSVQNLVVCFTGVIVPFFASALHMTRLYHITLLFLAPICIIGGINVIQGIIKLVGISWTDRLMEISVKLLSIYFAIFLLYQSGIVFELTEDSSTSISLNSTMDYPKFNDREVSGATWLNNVRDNKATFSDQFRRILLGSFDWDQAKNISSETASYVYLGTFNIMTGSIIEYYYIKSNLKTYYVRYSSLIEDRDLIYSNGGASIYGL